MQKLGEQSVTINSATLQIGKLKFLDDFKNFIGLPINFFSVTGHESKRSWLPEGKRTGGRGNPRLVARHVLSSSLQGQALAAVTASTVKSNLKTEGGVDESEKKLPPQV